MAIKNIVARSDETQSKRAVRRKCDERLPPPRFPCHSRARARDTHRGGGGADTATRVTRC